jgi:hypothetical protein
MAVTTASLFVQLDLDVLDAMGVPLALLSPIQGGTLRAVPLAVLDTPTSGYRPLDTNKWLALAGGLEALVHHAARLAPAVQAFRDKPGLPETIRAHLMILDQCMTVFRENVEALNKKAADR